MTSKHRHTQRRAGQGFMLLEVLIALLIFSLGVLGLVGLQSAAAKQSGESRYRADAVLLANELIGMMWAGDHSNAMLLATYSATSTDAGFTAWKAKVGTTLPGALAPAVVLTTVTAAAPVVPAGANVPVTPDPSTQVQVTLSWHAAGSTSADSTHNIVVATQIK